MPGYITPGVYCEIVNDTPDENEIGRVDIAAFVGIASRGPLHRPTLVNSMAHFQATFGGFISYSHLTYTVKAFFENGGTRCYIVRVATEEAACASVMLSGQAGDVALRIVASSAGAWGNDLAVTLQRTSTFTTQLVPEAADVVVANAQRSSVQSVAGFAIGALVRIFRQSDQQGIYRVVTGISHRENALLWHTSLEPAYQALAMKTVEQPENVWIEQIEYTLTLHQAGQLPQTFSHLSLVPFSDHFIEQVINRQRPPLPITVHVDESIKQLFGQGTILQQVARLQKVQQLVERLPVTTTGIKVFLQGGQDGLENLQPVDVIGNADAQQPRGLYALEDTPDVAIVAIPDLMAQTYASDKGQDAKTQQELRPMFSLAQIAQMQQAMIDFCEARQRCIALLDPPVKAGGQVCSVGEIQEWRQRFQSAYAALYYPYAVVQDVLHWNGQLVRAIPPCGHVAGMCARIDAEFGAYRAPANEALRGIQDVSVHVTAAEHGELNEQSINAIRVFAGRGVRIYGARTLSNEQQWRYVNVQRLLLMLKRSIEARLQWTVFEPNTDELRRTLVASITTLLAELWQKGAFVGASAAEAFFVKCDAQNNPPVQVSQGELLIEVGVAPSVPTEFVVLRIRRALDTNDITT